MRQPERLAPGRGHPPLTLAPSRLRSHNPHTVQVARLITTWRDPLVGVTALVSASEFASETVLALESQVFCRKSRLDQAPASEPDG